MRTGPPCTPTALLEVACFLRASQDVLKMCSNTVSVLRFGFLAQKNAACGSSARDGNPQPPCNGRQSLNHGPQGSPKSLDILLRASTPEHCGQRCPGPAWPPPASPKQRLHFCMGVARGPPGAWQSQPSARPEPGAQPPSAQVSPATHSSCISSICQGEKYPNWLKDLQVL